MNEVMLKNLKSFYQFYLKNDFDFYGCGCYGYGCGSCYFDKLNFDCSLGNRKERKDACIKYLSKSKQLELFDESVI